MIDHNQHFNEHLPALNIEHRSAEHPDAHDWDYWDEHIQKTLSQRAGVLGSEADGIDGN